MTIQDVAFRACATLATASRALVTACADYVHDEPQEADFSLLLLCVEREAGAKDAYRMVFASGATGMQSAAVPIGAARMVTRPGIAA